MKSKLIMISSSIVTGLLGAGASFIPHELIKYGGLTPTPIPVLFVQLTGALYLGFALMNWMAKSVLIGGIYARPLCLGNFMHFMVGALALLKVTTSNLASSIVWGVAIIYVLFAVLFGIILFTIPFKRVS